MIRVFAHTFILYLLLSSAAAIAQKRFGNEWINPFQTYLKIPVTQNGFYKITGRELEQSGIPLTDIPVSAIQMFRRGQEIAIEISPESPEKLGLEGYIQFYGEKNAGTADSALYVSPESMPHPYYSLYSDTATYFLTWRLDAGFGKRIARPIPNAPKDTIDYHFQETFQLFNSHYLPGNFYPAGSNFDTGSVLSDYDTGEGWSGREIAENESFELSFSLQDVAEEHFKEAEIEILLAGWTAGNHSFEVWSGSKNHLKRKLYLAQFQDYNSKKIHTFLAPEDLNPHEKLDITLVPIGKGGHISVSYSLVRYPQKTTFKKLSQQKPFLFPKSQNTFWATSEINGIDFYNISNPINPKRLAKSNFGIALDGSVKVLGVKQLLQISRINLVNFKKINPLDFDYLIISHQLMHLPVAGIDPVQEYAKYRASKEGGSYKPLVINSSEVFDQFNYGDPGPLGIRNMISWFHQSGCLKFVFLIGRSIDPQKARKLSDRRNIDMVPNTGWPGSDIGLTMEPGSKSPPIVPIGRLNALTSENVYDYLLKVKAMEAEPTSASWRKNILHLSGGRSRDELSPFKENVKSFEQKIKNSGLAASVKTISKQTDDPVEEIAAHVPVNEGLALITLFGHSSLDVTDIDIGYASDEKKLYDNHPYYPAVIVNGCASGSIFYSNKTLSSDWIFTPNKGAVLFLAHTFNGASTSLKRYTDIFYEVIADSIFTSQPFGNIQQEAVKRNVQRNPNIYDRITVQQMNLHGDPAIRIFPAKLPDYTFDSTSIRFSDVSGKELSPASDSILIDFIIKNNGRYRKEQIHISFRRLTDSLLYSSEIAMNAMPVSDTVFLIIPNKPIITENEKWEFVIDEKELLTEENELNNRLIVRPENIDSSPSISDQTPPILLVNIDGRQLVDNDFTSPQPLIAIELLDQNISITDTSSIIIWLKPMCTGCTEKRIYMKNWIWKRVSDEHIYAELRLLEKLKEGTYLLTVRARDSNGNFTPDYEIHFRVSNDNQPIKVDVSPNPSGSWFKFTYYIKSTARIENAKLLIHNIAGKCVSEVMVKAHPGLNEWIWVPGELPEGIYLYRIIFETNNLPASPEAEHTMQGRLLWIR